jgi:hypothetical protein
MKDSPRGPRRGNNPRPPIRPVKYPETLQICPLDPGLIFDKIVIDLGGLKPSHLGPPETPKTRSTN